MNKKHPLFPNEEKDIVVEITNVKITTDFSRMGESNGIDITCTVLFKTRYEEILMNPDWEGGKPTEKLKEVFPNGYFIFHGFKKEKIHYHFFVDYDKQSEMFSLKTIKKKEEPHHYYLNSINERYTESAVKQFDQQLYEKILHNYIKKISYD